MSGNESGGPVGRLTRREAVVALGATLLAACLSDRPDLTDTNGNGGDATVEMTENLTFEPATVTINAGESVTWKNVAGFGHTATGDPSKANNPSNATLPEGASPWDSGLLGAGEEFTHTFDVAGEYKYFCEPHEGNGMFGTVIVNAS